MDGNPPSVAAEARFAAIIEAGRDCVLTADTAGRVVFANRAVCALFDGATDDVFDLYTAEARAIVRDVVMAELQRSGTWIGTLATRVRSGEVRELAQVFIAHHDETGNVAFFSVIAYGVDDPGSPGKKPGGRRPRTASPAWSAARCSWTSSSTAGCAASGAASRTPCCSATSMASSSSTTSSVTTRATRCSSRSRSGSGSSYVRTTPSPASVGTSS